MFCRDCGQTLVRFEDTYATLAEPTARPSWCPVTGRPYHIRRSLRRPWFVPTKAAA